MDGSPARTAPEVGQLPDDGSGPWHARSIEEAAAALGTGPGGLAPETATARLAETGPNRLPAPPRLHPLRRFLAQFNNLLILVLLAAAAITLGLGHIADAAVIAAVVLVKRGDRLRPGGQGGARAGKHPAHAGAARRGDPGAVGG